MALAASQVADMTRAEIEAAYVASVPEAHRASTVAMMGKYPESYLRARLAPAKRVSARGPRVARHCNDRGAS